jgi:uncharacterized protein (TIGR03437 family)
MTACRSSGAKTIKFAALISGLCLLPAGAGAQQNRITRSIDNLQRIRLSGQIHPKARVENDRGRVAPSLKLSYVTLALLQSPSQQNDLDRLLAEQQTPGSPNYHHWLTPEEYGERFGVSQDDLNKIAGWLQGQGLTIAGVARGRNWIAANGTAAQIEAAFQTEIHTYVADGQRHIANALEPSVPAAIAGVVQSIRGLNDFYPRPAVRAPRYNSASGNHYLAPNDLATIYNFLPLYGGGIDGSGQKIAIAGQTQIDLSDIRQFRSNYNLPASDPQIVLVPNTRDPGVSQDDLPEADLDVEWSGAVARNATIIYIYAGEVMQAVQYAIDQNLAPVISTSYGSCEPETSNTEAQTFRAWARQGNAQGITWFSASGDSGGADCDDNRNSGLAVDLPTSVPEVTSVGGTEFQESSGLYWNTSNDANSASAISYIPETAWNDPPGQDGEPSASGGGASVIFSRPSWQYGPGVPNDNARHVPDVSLTASAEHDGYLVYTGGRPAVYGGTSVPAPAFAGIAALLNQYLVSIGVQPGLGNMNPRLYTLAQTTQGVFHDIATGDNIVTVPCRARTCSATAVGYNAGPGYDSVTGLGSVDAWNLVTQWNNGTTAPPPSSVSLTLLSNLTTVNQNDVVFFIATATNAGGVTPAGDVTFAAAGSSLGSATLAGSAGVATATLAVTGAQLTPGSQTITASYNGSSSSSTVTSSVTLSIRATGGSGTTPVISGITDSATYRQLYSPGMILSAFGSQLASSTGSASAAPLPVSIASVAATVNGVAAPLYYVSSTQLNIQIPYETPVNSEATLTINNGGQVASQSFSVVPAAPAIYTDQAGTIVPNGSIARGQITTLYLTGAGAVTPAVATGAPPKSDAALSSLPAPVQPSVTVGGVAAPIQFAGIPYGLVGVVQINFRVPDSVPPGSQPVVVTINSASSLPARLNVTN